MKYSIIITAFNREWCIERAIISAVKFLDKGSWDGEIVIVDDGSTDNTVEVIRDLISVLKNTRNIEDRLVLVCSHENKGVCAAKNTGVRASRGEWVIFLDSDDELLENCFVRMNAVISNSHRNVAYFFETINDDFHNLESSDNFNLLTLNNLIINGTNGRDAVPVVLRKVKDEFPFDESIQGYEGLSYLAIVNRYDSIPFHRHPIIRVHTTHNGRLSSGRGINKRWGSIARGHWKVILKYWTNMTLRAKTHILLKFLKAAARSLLFTANEYINLMMRTSK